MALGFEERSSVGWLALPRIAIGALFVEAAARKISPRLGAEQLAAQLSAWSGEGRMSGLFREHLLPVVNGQLSTFATLATAGEIAAGASLVLGLASRAGALAALAMHAAYFLASGEQVNLLAGTVDLGVLVAGGGRALGLDGLIRRSSPRFFLG